jgi:hypothetical protein
MRAQPTRILILVLSCWGLYTPSQAQSGVDDRQAAREAVSGQHQAAQFAVSAEQERFERAMQDCKRTSASSLCAEREIQAHRRALPELQRRVHISAQAVRNEAAYDRSLAQARRIEATRAKPDFSAERATKHASKMSRYRAKQQRVAELETGAGQLKRAKSIARYEAKLARHRDKQTKLNARRALREQQKPSLQAQ